MTKEEIRVKAEEMIEAQMDESGLSREEVLEVSAICFLEQYMADEISREDLVELGEYLDFPFNMEKVKELKAKRQKQAEYRANRKNKLNK